MDALERRDKGRDRLWALTRGQRLLRGCLRLVVVARWVPGDGLACLRVMQGGALGGRHGFSLFLLERLTFLNQRTHASPQTNALVLQRFFMLEGFGLGCRSLGQ